MDANKFYLGKICKNNHEFESTGKTLRFKSDRSCSECKNEKRRGRNKKRKLENDKYFLGNLCVNNHKFEGRDKSKRFSSTGDCVECKSKSDQNSYDNRKESVLNQKRNYYKENKNDIQEKNKNYYKENRDVIIKSNKEYYKKNKKHLNKKNWERIKIKLEKDPIFRLNRRMSCSITKALILNNTSKGCKSYLDLVDFTLEELKIHLESKFKEGMSWENYGEWHVDHIIPKSRFDYKSPDDLSFKECWSLSNFQPLWKNENLSKGNKTMDEYLQYKKDMHDKD